MLLPLNPRRTSSRHWNCSANDLFSLRMPKSMCECVAIAHSFHGDKSNWKVPRPVSLCTSCTHHVVHVPWMLLCNKKYCYIFTTIHIIYTTITICLAFLFSSWSDNNNDIWTAFGCRSHRTNWVLFFRSAIYPSLLCDAGLLPHNHCILMGSPVRGGDRCLYVATLLSVVGIPALQPITPYEGSF